MKSDLFNKSTVTKEEREENKRYFESLKKEVIEFIEKRNNKDGGDLKKSEKNK